MALSVVNSRCFPKFSHTHEMGHNFGCLHNMENTELTSQYSHGKRYCEADSRS